MYKKLFIFIFYVFLYDQNCVVIQKYYTDTVYVNECRQELLLKLPLIFDVAKSDDTVKTSRSDINIIIQDEVRYIKIQSNGYDLNFYNSKIRLIETEKIECIDVM